MGQDGQGFHVLGGREVGVHDAGGVGDVLVAGDTPGLRQQVLLQADGDGGGAGAVRVLGDGIGKVQQLRYPEEVLVQGLGGAQLLRLQAEDGQG